MDYDFVSAASLATSMDEVDFVWDPMDIDEPPSPQGQTAPIGTQEPPGPPATKLNEGGLIKRPAVEAFGVVRGVSEDQAHLAYAKPSTLFGSATVYTIPGDDIRKGAPAIETNQPTELSTKRRRGLWATPGAPFGGYVKEASPTTGPGPRRTRKKQPAPQQATNGPWGEAREPALYDEVPAPASTADFQALLARLRALVAASNGDPDARAAEGLRRIAAELRGFAGSRRAAHGAAVDALGATMADAGTAADDVVALLEAYQAAVGIECGDNLGFGSAEACRGHFAWLDGLYGELEARTLFGGHVAGPGGRPPEPVVSDHEVIYAI